MNERIIRGDACVAEGAAWLAQREVRFASVRDQVGPLPLRLKPDGFAPLLEAIIGQQVSLASATAITKRMAAAGMTTPEAINGAEIDDLRGLGLSQQKARYAKALAAADLPFDDFHAMPTEEVTKRLTEVAGIGPWTAQIYTMFSLGRADVFAPGDLALQEAARLVFDLPERPTARELNDMAARWSPWRSVAARILWAYYKHAKNREGII